MSRDEPCKTPSPANPPASKAGGSPTKKAGARFNTITGDDWKRAYEIAQEQNAGQAFATMVLDTNVSGQYDNDPFDYDDPYEEVTHPEHGGVATGLSWGANIAGSLALDPFYLAGKGIGIARQANMGASGYGKPVLDRFISEQTPLDPAARCALVSMDSTMRSNVTVAPPIEMVLYQRDSLVPGRKLVLDEDSDYLREVRQCWDMHLHEAFGKLPPISGALEAEPRLPVAKRV